MAGVAGRKKIHGTKAQQVMKVKLLDKCYNYLFSSFTRFTTENKIKVALALCTKDLTQKVEHSGEITLAQAIKKANQEGTDGD